MAHAAGLEKAADEIEANDVTSSEASDALSDEEDLTALQRVSFQALDYCRGSGV